MRINLSDVLRALFNVDLALGQAKLWPAASDGYISSKLTLTISGNRIRWSETTVTMAKCARDLGGSVYGMRQSLPPQC